MNHVFQPKEEKTWLLFSVRTCLGTLETNVLRSFFGHFFCKGLIINVTLLTLKISVHKIKTSRIFSNSNNESI